MSCRVGYTAKSLEAALKQAVKTIGIVCEWPKEGLDCPIINKDVYEDAKRCCGDPAVCEIGQARECRRKIRVASRANAAFCATLTIRHTVSKTDNNGFVEEKDSVLQRLFERKYLSKTDLVACAIHYS